MTYSEKNLMVFFNLLAASADTAILRTPHYSCLQVENSTYPSVLFLPKFTLENAPDILEKVRNSSLPQVMRCSPILTDKITLQGLVENTAYQRTWAAMSLNLDDLKSLEKDNDLEIKVITEQADIKSWTKIVGTELMNDANLDDTLFYKMSKNPSCKFYLASKNGIPAATAMTIITDEEVGIYLIATSLAYRKQGIGKQITVQPLLDAKEFGCTFAHLEATALGESVYKKIGFVKMADIPVFRI
jgi:predicted GNAT family acetyltransferase